jgi:metal-sulfur cluster biosynthetic enzyme
MKPTDNIQIALASDELKQVLDPEIGINIVDLGMVRNIDVFDQSKTINVALILTSEFCPMADSIMENTKNTLESFFSGYIATVHLLSEPKWNADLISDEGKRLLNL